MTLTINPSDYAQLLAKYQPKVIETEAENDLAIAKAQELDIRTTMKISEIYLKNYLQFRNFHLNLAYPNTGKPLDKVCFIGANGTGKSTLLKIINILFLAINDRAIIPEVLEYNLGNFNFNSLIGCRIEIKSESIYIFLTHKGILASTDDSLLEEFLENDFNFRDLSEAQWKIFEQKTDILSLNKIRFKAKSPNIVCYSTSDSVNLGNNNLPDTNLNKALELFKDFPIFCDASSSNFKDFWKTVIYQIKQRERDYLQFLETSENQNLKVSDVKERFNKEYPEILTELAEQWNLILERAGLEFDVENAKIPVQLHDNLEAYIRLCKSKKVISYNKLSTGIRNFIFQLGHIYALYFNRDIKQGFLLIDEPESSLFPDLLYDLIDRYLSIIQNTQFFVATHSPIIAAQFEPAERFILEFDDDGYVNARLGVSPEGDDPNDLLANDFVVRSLYGKKGIEQWERYLYLRRKIVETEDLEEKKSLLREYSSIGNAYNFLPNEISE